MAHTSLYRKYRPATFDDVVGQQHIERTLRNAVGDGSVAHAYLFSGPRGTGKTTTARLLAKALLCERGPTPEPDATCEQCIEVAEGRHPDVYELDAASRTGVDNVREEIIGRVSFAPTRGRYKVYIIDEVHMLSTAAFNALLKTLEEPPPNVIFILCTTHPNKVPETIQSRCQRFDFRRLSVEDIADRLRYIAEAEGMNVERGAFTLMARHASGGMRDAITSLEQIAAFTGGEVTTDDVEGMLGEVDSAQLFEAASLIARRDIAGGFRWVASMVETGTELAELVRELTGHVRDLFVIAAVGDATGVVDRAADEIAQLSAQAAEFGGPDQLARVLDILGELAAEMRWSSDPRLSLEVALTRMARPQGETTLEALAERVEALELGAPAVAAPPREQTHGVSPGASPAPLREQTHGVSIQHPDEHAARDVRLSDADDATSPAAITDQTPVPPAAPPARRPGKLDRGAMKRDWQAVLLEIKKRKPARVQTFTNVEVDVDPDGETLVIEFPADQSFSLQLAEEADNRELVKTALGAVFGSAMPFRYQLGRGPVRPATGSAKESAPAPVAAVVPTPKQDAEPEMSPAVDPEPEPEQDFEPEAETEPVQDLESEPVRDPGPQPEPESEPDHEPATQAAPDPVPDPAPVADDSPAQDAPVSASDLEALLNGLGATIVEERPGPVSDDEEEI